jgi:fucose 4-O-acetylase-like acetyltransferase
VLLGYYRTNVGKIWQKIPKLPFLLAMSAIVLASIWAAQQDMQLGIWPSNVSDRAMWLRFTDRSINGPIRLVNLFALFSLMFSLVDAFWQPLYKSLGKLLVPLGQNSLYVYVLHVPVTVLWFLIPGLVQGSAGLTTLLQAIAIGFFWLTIQYQVLFDVIPR